MSRIINQIDPNTDTFFDWLGSTNAMANAFAKTITVASNTTGDITSGNGYVSGVFGANVIVAPELRGGSIAAPGTVNVSSNVIFNGGQSTFNSNVYIVAANVAIYSNSVIQALSITNDGSSTVVSLAGDQLVISANVTFNGRVLKIPSSNTLNRPTPSNGSILYNTDTGTLDIVVGSNWTTIATGNTDLSSFLLRTGDSANARMSFINTAFTDVYAANASSNSVVFKTKTSFIGNVSISNAVSISDALAVTSTATFGNNLTVAGNGSVSGNLVVTGGSTFGNTLNVTSGELWENGVRVVTSSRLHAITEKTTLANTDEFFITDSGSAFAASKATANGIYQYVLGRSSAVYVNVASIATVSDFIANTNAKVLSANSVWGSVRDVVVTWATTITPDANTVINGTIAMTGNANLAFFSNPKPGQSGILKFTQDVTGNRTLNVSTSYIFAGGVRPTLSTNANAVDLLFYVILGNGTQAYASLVKNVS